MEYLIYLIIGTFIITGYSESNQLEGAYPAYAKVLGYTITIILWPVFLLFKFGQLLAKI